MNSAEYAPRWRKSTYSNFNGSCVEVAPLGDERVGVRHSKDPSGPVLRFSDGTWIQFINSIKADSPAQGQ
ncbi:DUF397 domain-containing protein [Nonomuraea sp. LPB2021202275-12-8]|uniref:DUF397 domain-containing protein n=1 Tax=Nonomuraea sp. LPB2021202275-12-8 TaxID=3120159 RepID=UPI00300D2AD1